jgi:glycyl-tRNA synthetase beta chain
VLAQADSRQVRLKGPSIKVGLDDNGQPTVALTKWAEKQGVAIADLERDASGKQETFVANKVLPGARLGDVINEVIESAISALPIPKLMQYQLEDGQTTISFVRPAHHLIVLHGDQLMPAHALGLNSDRNTYGHRFSGAKVSASHADVPIEVKVDSADNYENCMRDANVVVRFDERRDLISGQLQEKADALKCQLGDNEQVHQLLDEVTALVENPAVYVGRFEEKYLQVPPECLILTMRTNQKYFPLFNAAGELTNQFLICSNLAIDDPSLIIDGNERVVRPRLADAEFFYDQDRKQSLSDRRPRLAAVVYHAKLGSQAQRTERVAALAVQVAQMMGLDKNSSAHCERAAQLAKTDLLTGMVGEFPELQGIMGSYYARHDKEDEAVAIALTEQYQPRYAGDDLPVTDVGTVLAISDKMETLAGLFSIGQRPSGDKDPFALRRHALGVIRMLTEKKLPVSLAQLIEAALQPFQSQAAPKSGEESPDAALTGFISERLTGYLRDGGYASAQVAAVLSQGDLQLDRIHERLDAVAQFSEMPEAQALAAANKRIGNILRKADADLDVEPDTSLFQEPAEQKLADTLARLKGEVDDAVDQAQYKRAMTLMAQAREPVDQFFDEVMVMAEDPAVRQNRLVVLHGLHKMMNRVADISRLANN